MATTKFKSAAEVYRVILAKNPNITATEALAEAKKMGMKATSASSFYDTKSRMGKSTTKVAKNKKKVNKADLIRGLLSKRPNVTLDQARAVLGKKGVVITDSQFYDIRRKFFGTAVVAHKKQGLHRRIQEDSIHESESMSRIEWELEDLRRQNQRLQAVIVALLS